MTHFAARRFAGMSQADRARLVGLFTAWQAAGSPELPAISDGDRDLLFYLAARS